MTNENVLSMARIEHITAVIFHFQTEVFTKYVDLINL